MRRRFSISLLVLPITAFIAGLLFFCQVRGHMAGHRFMPSDQDEVVRVHSDLVLLNVTVTDKNGKYIHGLSSSDFKVFEDGHEQSISSFGVEETPFAAALLLDTSGSMERRLSLARAAAIHFLEGLRPDDVASVYRFDTDVEMIADFSSSRDLPDLAFGLRAGGLTVLNDAVLQAANDLSKRQERRRAIILLSDGVDTFSSSSAEKSLNRVLTANASVYSVDLTDPGSSRADAMTGSMALRSYAHKSGGRYISSPGGKALRDAFAEILEELQNQYTIGYIPNNHSRDGRWREVTVKVDRSDLKLRTRSGYRVAKA